MYSPKVWHPGGKKKIDRLKAVRDWKAEGEGIAFRLKLNRP
jgi:hypothetical protein